MSMKTGLAAESGCPTWAKWAVVLLLGIVYAVYGFGRYDLPRAAFFGGDTWEYQSMAVNFAHGHGLRMGAVLPFEEYRFDGGQDMPYYQEFIDAGRRGGDVSVYRTPGYPVLLGLIYWIAGVRPDVAVAVQMVLLALVAALLPMLGDAMLGWRGFLAGLIAGAVFFLSKASSALEIMTEPLIVLACFLVLAAWVYMNRREGWFPGAVFGLALAFALLVKGSLIFLVPLFLGYVILRRVTAGAYRRGAMLAAVLACALPLAAYATYASKVAGRLVLLSTQGDIVLLIGHNEYSLHYGGWYEPWAKDPTTFYSRALAAGEKPGVALVARFYRQHPSWLPRIMLQKIATIGHGPTLVAFMAACFAWTALIALRALLRHRAAQYAGTLAVVAAIVAFRANFLLCFFGSLAALAAGCLRGEFRRRLLALWREPMRMGLILVMLNFLALTLAIFAFPRFVWPAYFVFLLMGAYLLLRIAEEMQVWPGVRLLPAKGARASVLGWAYRRLRRTAYRRIAAELNASAPYFDIVYYTGLGPRADDLLFDALDAPQKARLDDALDLPMRDSSAGSTRALVLNGVFNSCLDIQGLLMELKARLARQDRLLVLLYNPYLRGLYAAMDRLGLRRAPEPVTFITQVELESLARLGGFELARLRPAAHFPLRLLGLGALLDRLLRLLPVVRRLGLAHLAVLRPVIAGGRPSLSVVVPARNERGNIRAALERMPVLPGVETEVIFVEGHSTDGTWEEIARVAEEYRGPLKLRMMQQTGRGKADAVRMGFDAATGDLLTILDADLTMPPEMLGRFYEAYVQGHGDFINGNRLLYPMESRAMRFLNRLGNVFFAKALSYVLDARLGDSLCGTKLLTRHDWRRVQAWRRDFGQFDPFGDFELLFPAAELALGVVDLPVRYRDRTYGATNILRFRHGLMLARMTWLGFWRIKLGLRDRVFLGRHTG